MNQRTREAAAGILRSALLAILEGSDEPVRGKAR